MSFFHQENSLKAKPLELGDRTCTFTAFTRFGTKPRRLGWLFTCHTPGFRSWQLPISILSIIITGTYPHTRRPHTCTPLLPLLASYPGFSQSILPHTLPQRLSVPHLHPSAPTPAAPPAQLTHHPQCLSRTVRKPPNRPSRPRLLTRPQTPSPPPRPSTPSTPRCRPTTRAAKTRSRKAAPSSPSR